MKSVHATAIVTENKSNPPGGASVNNIAFTIEPNLRKDKATNNATLECSSCHKILPSKEALKSHFQVMNKVYPIDRLT